MRSLVAPFCALAVLLVVIGCDGSGPEDEPADEDRLAVVQGAGEVSVALTRAFEGAALAVSSYQAITPGKATTGDTLFKDVFTCPLLISDSTTDDWTLDFGQGCTAADGRTRSGSVTVDLNAQALSVVSLGLTYDAYTSGASTLDGAVLVRVITLTGAISVMLEEVAVTNEAGTTLIDAVLELDVDTNGTVDPADDRYELAGDGFVEGADGFLYAFEITEPLVVSGTCAYPTSGAIALTQDRLIGDDLTATINFSPEAGACDDLVDVTALDQTTTLRLAAIER